MSYIHPLNQYLKWLVTLFSLITNEMIYEMNHVKPADMKSSDAVILAVMNAILAFA